MTPKSAACELILVARLASAELRPVLSARLERLAQIYELVEPGPFVTQWLPDLRVAICALGIHGASPDENAGALGWGPVAPSDVEDPAAVMAASSADLRELSTPRCIVGWTPDQMRIATSSGPLQVLYEAEGGKIQAWSTHAVAAGVTALERPSIDPLALGELVGCEFVGGDRTLLAGVRALEPATVIDVSKGGVKPWSCFPATERWRKLPAAEAAETVEAQLLDDLQRAVMPARAPVLGTTAGLDSCTVAVALSELGIPFTAFTFDFGGEGADVVGAREVARELGVPHVAPEPEWWADEDGLERLRAEAVWTDGTREVGYGSIRWPAEMDRWVLGVGAETGRAFYWGWLGERLPEPRVRTLENVLRLAFEPRLVGARKEQLTNVRSQYRQFLEEARHWGHQGWSAVDVVYANQRVRRWARGQLHPNRVPTVPAFAGARMSQALASLSVSDRLVSGWQRRFIASRRPSLTDHVRRDEHSGRAAASPLLGSLAQHHARFARRRLRLPSRTVRRVPEPWYEAVTWQERPGYVNWLFDDVLRSPLLEESLGEQWLRELRRRVMAGDDNANLTARFAAAPVALAQRLG